jgi:hypothetical protein
MGLLKPIEDDQEDPGFFDTQVGDGLLNGLQGDQPDQPEEPTPGDEPPGSFPAASAVEAAPEATAAAGEKPKRGLLSRIGSGLFGTDSGGATFADRLIGASMGLKGDIGGEGTYFQGITDRTQKQALVKQQQLGQQIDSQAFNGAWDTDPKTGRRTFNQDKYLT